MQAAGFRVGDAEDFLGLTEDERRFVELATKTGLVYVASDVFTALQALGPVTMQSLFTRMEIRECKWLKPGDILAVDEKKFDPLNGNYPENI